MATVQAVDQRIAAARADLDAARRALRKALLSGADTAAAREFLAAAEAEGEAATRDLAAVLACQQRQDQAAVAVAASKAARRAAADLRARLAAFVLPPAPASSTTPRTIR
jgi:hypothetical protein